MDAQELRNLQEAYMEVYQEQEEINVYNASLQYLINEGYAETLEEAQDIYLNLDEASKNTLSKAVGKLAWKATKAGAKLALKGAKTAVKAVRDYGGDYPIGSKRRAVSDTIDKVHWASLSDAERRKRTNAKHRARNTKKGHEEIMARNRRSQEVSDRWHEQQRKKQERKRAVSDTIDKVHWASLSDAERRKRTNAKHRARNTKKGHEEIMPSIS